MNPAGPEIPASPLAQLNGGFCALPVGRHQVFGTGLASFTWGLTLAIFPDDKHLRVTHVHVDLITIPEPSTWLLLASGIMMILAVRGWRRRTQG
jgi:PEP-CTERM motif